MPQKSHRVLAREISVLKNGEDTKIENDACEQRLFATVGIQVAELQAYNVIDKYGGVEKKEEWDAPAPVEEASRDEQEPVTNSILSETPERQNGRTQKHKVRVGIEMYPARILMGFKGLRELLGATHCYLDIGNRDYWKLSNF